MVQIIQFLFLFTCLQLYWSNGYGLPVSVVLRMTNTLLNNKYACGNNTVVTFTCETMGATVLVWSSEELIGSGGIQLPFAAGANNPGDRRNSTINDHTYAVLTVKEMVGGQIRLVSKLFVNATFDVPRVSVTCHNQADDDPITTPFIVLDLPGVPQDVFGFHLQRISDINDMCLISSFWRGPDNSLHAGNLDYMVSVDGNLSKVETMSITGVEGVRNVYFSLSNCSSVNISVGAMNVCGMGPMSDNITLDPIPCENASVCPFIKFLWCSSAPLMSSLNKATVVVALATTMIISHV